MITIILDVLNLILIIYLIIKLVLNYHLYKNNLKLLRLVIIIIGILMLFIIVVLLVNSVEWYTGVTTGESTIPFMFSRIMIRCGILFVQLVFLGLIRESKLFNLEFWKSFLKP